MSTLDQSVVDQPIAKSSSKKWGVALLGESGFPIGMAAIEKLKLLGKGLLHAGATVTVINRKGVFKPGEKVELEIEGHVEGLHYIYTSGTIYRAPSFIKRNITKIRGLIGEWRYLSRMKKEGRLDSSLLSTMRFSDFLFYRIASRLIGFQLIFMYVELTRTLVDRKGFWVKLNDRLLDQYALNWSDGILPISDLLIKEIEMTAPKKPYMKVPVLCDFDKFMIPKNSAYTEDYLLFCGSANYSEVIHFILDAYEKMEFEGEPVYLYLVIGGNDKAKQLIQERIAGMDRKDTIRWFSRIPYAELIDKYVNAKGLLIPLRNTPQDKARFPHKIGEYLAAGNPVITTKIGEIKNYFVDGETALVADDYQLDLFVEKMEYVINNREAAVEIGKNGNKMGLENFDYRSYGLKIKDFMEEIANRQRKA